MGYYGWTHVGARRPPFARPPGPGQESVWDYPRPPRLERVERELRVVVGGTVIAATRSGWRICETASPPTYYIPPQDVRVDCLRASRRRSFCEWKGTAHYFDALVNGRRVRDAAWCYPEPPPELVAIREALAFYPALVDACFVGDQRVQAQPGDFYGGWITADLVGPFKGEPGTEGW